MVIVWLPETDQLPTSLRSCTYRMRVSPSPNAVSGVKVVSMVSTHVPTSLSSWYRKVPLPPPPDVQDHIGVVSWVGVVPVTPGGLGTEVSILIVKLPEADQFSVSSRSWTYRIWDSLSPNSVAGVKVVSRVSVHVPASLSNWYR